MFHLGTFESSLRNSDGGKKYSARKRKEAKAKFAEVGVKNRFVNGKAQGCGIEKSKNETDFFARKKKVGDQCVPKSDESLTDSAVEIDHKVPGSSQEASVDESIGLSESDNEKLKSIDCDNCENTRKTRHGGDNKITSVKDAFGSRGRVARSRSWDAAVDAMKPTKILKIRGPFGSLVDLSNPSERNPFGAPDSFNKKLNVEESPIVRVVVRELPDVTDIFKKPTEETEAKENQSEKKLFEAIDTLSKRLREDGEKEDIFEDLEVEEFENAKVSKLFETYFKDVKTKETNDSKGTIERLLDSLKDLETFKRESAPRRSQRLLKSNCKAKDDTEAERHCKSHARDEDIIKNIIPNKKDTLLTNKARKNAELERKWIPGGISKRSSAPTDASGNLKINGRGVNNQSPMTFVSKCELIPQKSPVESVASVKSPAAGKSEKREKSKKSRKEIFLENPNGFISNLKKETSDSSSKLSKSKIDDESVENDNKRPSKNEILGKSNETFRKVRSKVVGGSCGPRSSFRRKERIIKVLEMESSQKDKALEYGSEGSKGQTTSYRKRIHLRIEEDYLPDDSRKIPSRSNESAAEPTAIPSNIKTVGQHSEEKEKQNGVSGKVKKLISTFEMNVLQPEDCFASESNIKPRSKTAAGSESYKKFEDFKKVRTIDVNQVDRTANRVLRNSSPVLSFWILIPAPQRFSLRSKEVGFGFCFLFLKIKHFFFSL